MKRRSIGIAMTVLSKRIPKRVASHSGRAEAAAAAAAVRSTRTADIRVASSVRGRKRSLIDIMSVIKTQCKRINLPACVNKTWRSSTRWQEREVRWSARRPTRTALRRTFPCRFSEPCLRTRPWSWSRSPTKVLLEYSWSRSADSPAGQRLSQVNTTSIQPFVCHGYPSRFTILPATVRRNTPGWRTRRYPRPRRTRVTWAPWPTLWTCVWVFSAPGNVWSAWTTSGCEWLKKIPKFRYCRNDGPAYFGASCPCRNSTWPQSRLCSPEILQNA